MKIKVSTLHDKQVEYDNLTRLRMSMFPLVVLLLQLRVGPGPQGHSALSTVTGHSYRFPCKTTMNSTRSTDWMDETILCSTCLCIPSTRFTGSTQFKRLTSKVWSMSDPHRHKETVHVHMKNTRFNTCGC